MKSFLLESISSNNIKNERVLQITSQWKHLVWKRLNKCKFQFWGQYYWFFKKYSICYFVQILTYLEVYWVKFLHRSKYYDYNFRHHVSWLTRKYHTTYLNLHLAFIYSSFVLLKWWMELWNVEGANNTISLLIGQPNGMGSRNRDSSSMHNSLESSLK